MVKCTSCGREQPELRAYKCPRCGGVYDFAEPITFDLAQVDSRDRSMWRFRHTFPLPAEAAPVSLGEGGTPLVRATVDGRAIHFKAEYLNPTGSFKDRGMSLILTQLNGLGVTRAAEDSSGNAGASFAAYAARAGIHGRVFVPESASGPKREQIRAYGAEMVPIPGPRTNAADAVQKEVGAGDTVYASHVYNPLALVGYATIAYEIFEGLGHAPEAVIVPAGQGGLLLGIYRGFQALQRAGRIPKMPQMIGVQALACAPLFMVHTSGASGLQWVTEGQTIAEGIRVLRPVRGDAVIAAVRASGGTILAYDEASILEGRNRLAQLGLYVEPTSAVVWPALVDAIPNVPGDIVGVLTGSGFKSQ